jgi:hypothetical protein
MGECMYSSTFFSTSSLAGDEWSASCSGRFIREEKNSFRHSLDRKLDRSQIGTGDKKNSYRSRDSKAGHSVVQPVASRYIECTTADPCLRLV